MIEEIKDDLREKPDLVITSVGGGGLALGLLEGASGRRKTDYFPVVGCVIPMSLLKASIFRKISNYLLIDMH